MAARFDVKGVQARALSAVRRYRLQGPGWVARLAQQQVDEATAVTLAAFGPDHPADGLDSLIDQHRQDLLTVLTRETIHSKVWCHGNASQAQRALGVWPPPIPVAMAIDTIASRSGHMAGAPMYHCRRTHHIEMLAAAALLIDQHTDDLKATLRVELAQRMKAARGVDRFLDAVWSGGGPARGHLKELDGLIQESAAAVGEAAPRHWARNLDVRVAAPLLPSGMLAHLDSLMGSTEGLPHAWHAPRNLALGTRGKGGGLVRSIRILGPHGRTTVNWDEWITGGLGTVPRRVVVQGHPGYGKTTLLRREARTLAGDAAAAIRGGRPAGGLIPVLMTCSQFTAIAMEAESSSENASGPTLVANHLASTTHKALAPTVVSEPETLCLLLDAYDETSRPSVLASAITNDALNPFGRVIITTRPSTPLPPLRDWTTVDLDLLRPEDVAALIGTWFAAADGRTGTDHHEAERSAAGVSLKERIAADPAFADLLRIPLFAVLACTITDPVRADMGHGGYPWHRRPEDLGLPSGWIPSTRAELLWATVVDRVYGVGIDTPYEDRLGVSETVRLAARVARLWAEAEERAPSVTPGRLGLERWVAQRDPEAAKVVPRLLGRVGGYGGSGLLTTDKGTVGWLHKQVEEYLRAHDVALSTDPYEHLVEFTTASDTLELSRLLIGELLRIDEHSHAAALLGRLAEHDGDPRGVYSLRAALIATEFGSHFRDVIVTGLRRFLTRAETHWGPIEPSWTETYTRLADSLPSRDVPPSRVFGQGPGVGLGGAPQEGGEQEGKRLRWWLPPALVEVGGDPRDLGLEDLVRLRAALRSVADGDGSYNEKTFQRLVDAGLPPWAIGPPVESPRPTRGPRAASRMARARRPQA